MSPTRYSIQALLIAGWLSVGGCGDDANDEDGNGDEDGGSDEDAGEDEEPIGEPTGAECPEGSTLTYDSFAKGFFAAYCTSCHDSSLEGVGPRMGAPDDHNFDSLEGILDDIEHVAGAAAAGPDATNDSMPPLGDKPSLEERKQLGEWIACGAPE